MAHVTLVVRWCLVRKTNAIFGDGNAINIRMALPLIDALTAPLLALYLVLTTAFSAPRIWSFGLNWLRQLIDRDQYLIHRGERLVFSHGCL
jgi:hypothetical protein